MPDYKKTQIYLFLYKFAIIKNMAKIRVGVLRGGPSNEHEVSLKTGENVLEFLPKEKYQSIDILLDRNGKLFVNGSSIKFQQLHYLADVIFNSLHGCFGEDGKIQRLLDDIKMPYTGSGSVASALGMNKVLSRGSFQRAGLKIPRAFVIREDNSIENEAMKIFHKLSPPWVVKPVSGGSSIGVKIIRNFHDLMSAIKGMFDIDTAVIIEEFIKGREVTCGVLDGFRGEEYYALPVIEILPPAQKSFFDYECKYDGSTSEICPAPFDLGTKKEIERSARLAHQTLGCSGYSRSDMIVSSRGIYLLELNTLPGLTSESLLPKSAEAVGLSFPSLLDHILQISLSRF